MNDDERPVARYVRPGELLAMDPSRIHRGPEGFFWLFGGGPKPNERRGDIAIVHVRGELEHHKGWCESYEGIVERFAAALSGKDVADAHELAERRKNYGNLPADYQPLKATPPAAVMLCIDSPGGVVAGLNETVATLGKMKRAAKIPVIVFVNEMAASAAYALATVGDKIYCPPSAILGSVGVISTMISQAKKNQKDGYDVELLTSGARKADGHLHAPITAAARAAEMDRVMKLAAAFWGMVSKARRIPVAKIRSFEAGIFLGADAVGRGLADAVMSWDAVLLGERDGDTVNKSSPRKTGGNQTDRRVTEPTMSLAALIKKTEAKIAAETDPDKLAKLYANLAAYKKTEKHVEHTKTEEGDEGEDDEDKDEGDDEDEDEDEEEEAAPSSKQPMKGKAKASEEGEEESEEEEAKAALALVRSLSGGKKGAAARGAVEAQASLVATVAADVKKLKAEQTASSKAAMIERARASAQITRKEAKDLGEKPLSFVKSFLEMRAEHGFVVTDEGALAKPKHVQPGTEASLPAETLAQIDSAVANFPGDKKAFRKTLVDAHLAKHAENMKAALGGAEGRY